MLATIATQNHL